MKPSRASEVGVGTLLYLVVCLVLSVSLPHSALAQCTNNQGFNTIYGTCPGPGTQGTFAFVDAARYSTGGSSPDICGPIHTILKASKNPNGVVIDARGFGATTLSCTTNQNPWDGTTLSSNVVLLPAGTITINQPWILPRKTRLIGAGVGLTTILANFSGDMIDMGNSMICGATCVGIAIEHLTLNGNSNNVNGIVNKYAQELSYVNDVVMTGMGSSGNNIGLWLDTHSNNSGPYTNIKYSGSGACAQIYDDTGSTINRTRGIRGLTCIMSGASPSAVYLDARLVAPGREVRTGGSFRKLHFPWPALSATLGSRVRLSVRSVLHGPRAIRPRGYS